MVRVKVRACRASFRGAALIEEEVHTIVESFIM